jgi:hypothetical protein
MTVTTGYSLDLIFNSFSTSVFNGSNANPEVVALTGGEFAISANHTGTSDIEFYAGPSLPGTASVTGFSGTNMAMAALDNGYVAVAAQSGATGITFAVYDTAGIAVVSPTLFIDASTSNASVAALSGGSFVIAYEDTVAANNGDIELTFRSSAGAGTGSIIVDSTSANDRNPSICTLTNGNVAVAWQRVVGGSTELWFAIYTTVGAVVAGPSLIDNTGTINRDASIVATAGGGFAVAYEDNQASGTVDIALARVDAAGNLLGRTDVSFASGDQRNPDLSLVRPDLLLVAFAYDDGTNIYSNVAFLDAATGANVSAGGSPLSLSGSQDYDNFSVAGDSISKVGVAGANAANSTVTTEAYEIFRNHTGDGADDTMTGDDLRDAMYGNGGVDTLRGLGGKDSLDGGAGADSMAGGAGDDNYYVDETYDSTVEAANEGIDTVYTVITHALRVNVERLVLQGAANINGTGNTLENELVGNSGNNILNGLGGADWMYGNEGNDTYYIDNDMDSIVERAGQGIDITRSSVSIALEAEVEKLYLTGTAANGTGNLLSNYIYGNASGNRIDGQAGADRLYGDNGDDTFVVDSAGDLVFETSAAGGTDTVESSVNHTLSANVENLVLIGTENVNATGNTLSNAITGNSGNNFIYGKAGNDLLDGGGGSDQFVFDTALGASNIDTVNGFDVADDYLRLDDAMFAALVTGYLAATAFRAGSAAADADDRIIYNAVTGAALYDPDGTGVAAAVQFATLGPGLALAADDIYVF